MSNRVKSSVMRAHGYRKAGPKRFRNVETCAACAASGQDCIVRAPTFGVAADTRAIPVQSCLPCAEGRRKCSTNKTVSLAKRRHRESQSVSKSPTKEGKTPTTSNPTRSNTIVNQSSQQPSSPTTASTKASNKTSSSTPSKTSSSAPSKTSSSLPSKTSSSAPSKASGSVPSKTSSSPPNKASNSSRRSPPPGARGSRWRKQRQVRSESPDSEDDEVPHLAKRRRREVRSPSTANAAGGADDRASVANKRANGANDRADDTYRQLLFDTDVTGDEEADEDQMIVDGSEGEGEEVVEEGEGEEGEGEEGEGEEGEDGGGEDGGGEDGGGEEGGDMIVADAAQPDLEPLGPTPDNEPTADATASVPVLTEYKPTNLLDLPLSQGERVTPLSRRTDKTFVLDAHGRGGWVPTSSLGPHTAPTHSVEQLPRWAFELRDARAAALRAMLGEAAELRATTSRLREELRAAADQRTTQQMREELEAKNRQLGEMRAGREALERKVRDGEARVAAAEARNAQIQEEAKSEKEARGAELEMLRRALGAVYGVKFGWDEL